MDKDTKGLFFNNPEIGKPFCFLDAFDELKRAILGTGWNCVTIDFFAKAILDSACSIDAGFAQMINDGNFLCAIPLIRMQLDNALMAWGGLIARNDVKFFMAYMNGDIDRVKYDWTILASYGITPEVLDENGVKYDKGKPQMNTYFRQATLNLVRNGTTELYKKGCGFIHPSSSIFKASWFTREENALCYKPWYDIKPFQYSEGDLISDYLNVCVTLYWVMNEWYKVKVTNTNLYKMLQNGEPLPEGFEFRQSSREDTEAMFKMLLHEKDESQDLPIVDGE